MLKAFEREEVQQSSGHGGGQNGKCSKGDEGGGGGGTVRSDGQQAMEARLCGSVREAGSSIVVTTLTNVTAFCVGGSLPFPAISDFCILLALGVSFTLLFFVTFFVACIALDANRQAAAKTDLVFRPLVALHSTCCRRPAAVQVQQRGGSGEAARPHDTVQGDRAATAVAV